MATAALFSYPFVGPVYLLLCTNASISCSPERKKSRKLIPLHLHVSHTLRRIRYSRIPLSVLDPPTSLRSAANALIACSALLLFHGTPSQSKNVNSLSWFFSKRFLHVTASSLL